MFLFGMYFLDGFPTVISLSRLIISWISDASMDFVCFARVLSGRLCPSGGARSVAVCDGCRFRFVFDVWTITAFCDAGSSPMPSVWLFGRRCVRCRVSSFLV